MTDLSGRVIAAFLLFVISSFSVAQTIETFTYTGAVQNWVVPAGVTEVVIQTWGAGGSNSLDVRPDNGPGGLGGYASGTLAVTPGETLAIYVGGAGTNDGTDSFNGGAGGGFGTAGASCVDTYGGGGGGSSDVRQGGSALANRVIVAGGGGGGGSDYCNGGCQPCGEGGGGGANADLLGGNGSPAFDSLFVYPGSGNNFGGGATLVAGGAAGPQDDGATNVGVAGALGMGGAGSDGLQSVSGGGGGGGYYGGGGGGGASDGSGIAGGGGGAGSSYIGGVTSGSTTPALRAGVGEVVISYTVAGQVPVPALPLLGLALLVGLLTLVASKRFSSRIT